MQLLQIIINVIIILHLHFFVVLVAHNGFSFDFPLMLAEVERRPKQLALCLRGPKYPFQRHFTTATKGSATQDDFFNRPR